MSIVFNRPYLAGRELLNIAEAHFQGRLAGDGEFSRRCQAKLEDVVGVSKALLTHSCTAALEMAAVLANIQPGDEVIMPSYTFVSTANAFVLRGGIPVFIDIRPDTLNMDETLIEAAITERTRAIVPVHYAGVACEMDAIMRVAKQYKLLVIEDAAQAFLSSYRGKALGSIGDVGCLSFHETKNVISGEGGALLLRNPTFADRAEIIREKGTNRSKFFRGEIDKYTWCDVGSSYLPGELIAAFLWAQLEDSISITQRRMQIWDTYHMGLGDLEASGRIKRPTIPEGCRHNAHMYYLITNSLEERSHLIDQLKNQGIMTVFHYVPLHNSPAGKRFGKVSSSMRQTEDLADRLIRLPLWIGVDANRVLDAVNKSLR
jgi:dTDP-4-amino-4,6-dideoxygalactose transaminase